MEKTKYYTPDITEFHIGFEYEVQQHEMVHGKCIYKDKWETIECEGNMFLQDIDINSNHIRVKYLDKEDIESFGFEQIDCSFSKEWLSFLIKDDEDSTERLILDMNKTKVQIGNCGTYEDHIFKFNGIIQNKSELSFILKRLQIINE